MVAAREFASGEIVRRGRGGGGMAGAVVALERGGSLGVQRLSLVPAALETVELGEVVSRGGDVGIVLAEARLRFGERASEVATSLIKRPRADRSRPMSVYTRHCAVDLFAAVGYAAAMGASRVTSRALEPEVGAEEEDADVDAEGSACAKRPIARSRTTRSPPPPRETCSSRDASTLRLCRSWLARERRAPPPNMRRGSTTKFDITSRRGNVSFGNFEAIKLTARANARRARTGEESCRITVVACWRRRMRSRFCFLTAR